MSVGFFIDNVLNDLGPPRNLFHAVFSTIAANLESTGWGVRFPMLLQKLYSGELQSPGNARSGPR